MPRTTAGHRYPFASSTARVHDHAMCKVVETILARIESGAEAWGTPHDMPPLADEHQAHSVRNKIFGGKWCGQLEDAHGKISISVMYRKADGALTNTRVPGEGGYTLVVRVFTREAGQRTIVNRVKAGEPLAFNPYRER